MNLPQQLQEYLKYPPLQTIDPNTGLPADQSTFDPLTQGALITFLAGLYKATRTIEGASEVSRQKDPQQMETVIFGNQEREIEALASYAKQDINRVKRKLTEVAVGYRSFIQQQDGQETNKESYLQNLMTSQRNEILKYIPGDLKLGELLQDEVMDDNTNKMEGPVSTLMHKIENVFSKSD
jgi:hypothetical protein